MEKFAKAVLGELDPGRAQFLEIHQAEIESINKRRVRNRRRKVRKTITAQGGIHFDTIGLSLSGGGIRSAAFCLGALQALHHDRVLEKVDYLSTVSGGGYIGAALTATMSKSEGEFVFERSHRDTGASEQLSSEISDTEAVGHIRNYSNYLIPFGFRDVLTGTAIVLRGLIANIGSVLPFILLAAAVTVLSNPDRSALTRTDFFGIDLSDVIPVEHFGITLELSLAMIAVFFAWALYRSFLPPRSLSEFREQLPALGASLLALLAIVFFLELQPFLIDGMFAIGDGGGAFHFVSALIEKAAAIATPLAAIVALFRQQIGSLLKKTEAKPGISSLVVAFLTKVAIWIAALALPLLLWLVYLYCCYWGIIDDQAADAAQGKHTPPWLIHAATDFSQFLAGWLGPFAQSDFYVSILNRPMILLYTTIGLILLLLSSLLTANANSLHRLYRDRLSKAFLFDPDKAASESSADRDETTTDQRRDFAPLDAMRLSEISPDFAPCHLINAALNIQGSDYANRRGRNADFFVFSRLYTGSFATGYALTAEMEKAAPGLDLATAMAISGAAVSSNMGSEPARPFAPTLALLNIRLGYWLKNPRYVGEKLRGLALVGRKVLYSRWYKPGSFLWSEITGRLYESGSDVYLTDGGHIENLGIYELLRRKCGVIVAIDVEADPGMHYSSFITLQRYARIDLGIRIEMPWDKTSALTTELMKKAAPSTPQKGPHVSVGIIDYGDGANGYLIYIKASLTGDENDYVRDYGRRYQEFPHESTGDQFFSEEQFEAYRALGFHITHGALNGDHKIEVAGQENLLTFKSQASKELNAVRKALI